MPRYYPHKGGGGGGKSMLMFKATAYSIGDSVIEYLGKHQFTATENAVKFVVVGAGTIRKLYFWAGTNNFNANTVITIRKNGVDTALTVTIASGGLSGNDTAHEFTVAAGDVISVEFDTTASITGDMFFAGVTLEFEPS